MADFNLGDYAIIRSTGIPGKVVYIEDGYVELEGKNGAVFTVDGPEFLDKPRPAPEPKVRENYGSMASAIMNAAVRSGDSTMSLLLAPVPRGPLPDPSYGSRDIGGVTVGGHTVFLAALLHNNVTKVMKAEGLVETTGTWDSLTDEQRLNYVDMLHPGAGVVDALRKGEISASILDLMTLDRLGRTFRVAA